MEKGKTYVTYGDQVSLRALPSIDADKLYSIPANTAVTILEVSEKQIKVYGIDSPWVKVSVNGKEGYIASGFLALRSIKLNDGSDLIYTRVKEGHTEYEQSIAFRQVYDNIVVELGSYILGNKDFNVVVTDGRGLVEVDHLIQVEYLAEACGEEGGRTYFILSLEDNKWQRLGTFSSVGDGGVYHLSEDLTFPNDPNGMQDAIIFNGEQGEEDEEGVYKTVHIRKVYGWSEDGLSEPIVIPSYK
jgi:hypothetical protein